MVEEFEKCVNNYDLTKEKIILKKNHSIRVMNLCIKYAKKLGFNDEDVSLVKVIGLLHDIGRFEQLKEFNSFDDSNIDHADLGVKILFEEGLIKNFWSNKEDYEIIKFAIKNHELSNYKDIKNINDSIALKFAYTYDINYDECLEEFKQNLYYFYKQINFDERFKEIFETVNKYIDERIDKYVRN